MDEGRSLTGPKWDGTIPAMFRGKRPKQQQEPEAEVQQLAASPNGYQHFELPTFHGRKRKVIVYTTDAKGKVIKTPRR
jgi:hypothetical protein